jgi:hypothetical protein
VNSRVEVYYSLSREEAKKYPHLDKNNNSGAFSYDVPGGEGIDLRDTMFTSTTSMVAAAAFNFLLVQDTEYLSLLVRSDCTVQYST